MAKSEKPVELFQAPGPHRASHAVDHGAAAFYGLAARLEQVADHPLMLNQGTLYPALVRLEQKGWIKGSWQRTETHRDARYTRSPSRARVRCRSRPSAGGASPVWSTNC